MTDEAAPWEGDEGESPAPAGPRVISSVGDIAVVASYLRRIGAYPRSFRTAVVVTKTGTYDKEVATIKFSKSGVITAPETMQPTDEEAAAIAEAFVGVKFPTSQTLTALGRLPDEISETNPANMFIFKDERGDIVMLQVRVDKDDGTKAYVPWSYWSDGEWRRMEPEFEHLPVWGLEQLAGHSVAFIHEGAKSARAVRDQLDGKAPATNPWLNEMRNAAHLGWIGGAPNAHRTDWSVLRRKGVKRLYIVADNDAEGRAAVPRISREAGIPALLVQFTQEWPEGFDMGDEFPDDMWAKQGGEKVYTGPSFASTLHPSTWATDEVTLPPEGRGRPRTIHTLRPCFAAQWTWVESVDMFINNEFPSIHLKRDVFNASVRPFSHVRDTANLLQSHFTGRSATLTYRPDTEKRFVVDEGVSAINLYRPPLIKPKPGDATPWLEFMAYMFPEEQERNTVERWCATLIARPDIRMHFGLLMLSEQQGVGKTTLGMILADLVGRHNCSFPGVNMIVEQQFNGWLANKRLIVVNEIYEGHSWKAYNRLKTYVSDESIETNIKHQATYTIPNWTHYFLCSNELQALKIEDKDRRWYVPSLTEIAWNLTQFTAFRAWLAGGGLPKIANWARSYDNYVRPGEIAPMSVSKQRLIEESRSDAERLAKALGEIMMASDKPYMVPLTWVREWAKTKLGVVHETERRLGGAMRKAGVHVSEKQVSIKGKKHRFATNKPELLELPADKQAEHITHPKNLMEEEF